MLKSPQEYAAQILALFYGDKEGALIELYNAARQHPQTPARFWRDVAKAIESTL